MKLVESIGLEELNIMSKNMYDEMVKGVVDIEQKLLVLDAGLHSDEEQFLLENGSRQEDLWGINLYPDEYGTEDFIEFDSMINIRPSQDNRSRCVENENIQQIIREIVAEAVHE
ncbi:MAG: DUF5674 family protein [Coriobacteriales bacterium]|jgi:hypothetical protein|nr:DUF5674 family protein [Coriobacteriales bacterium]